MNKTRTLAALAIAAAFPCTAEAVLIHHWNFDEGSGTIAADSAGANNGDIIGSAVAWGTGTGDRASYLEFDGSSGNLVDPSLTLPLMTTTNDFSWSVWANVQGDAYDDSTGSQRNSIIIGNRRNTDSPGGEFTPRQFVKLTQRRFEFHHNVSGGSKNPDYPNLAIGEWTHLAVVKDGANLQTYVNGVPSGSETVTLDMADAMPFFMGGDMSSQGGEFFEGFIDEVRLYDNALTLSEVESLAGIPEPSTSLLGALGLGLLVGRRRR